MQKQSKENDADTDESEEENEIPDFPSSAFHQFIGRRRTPPTGISSPRPKRDSGYVTENSPASETVSSPGSFVPHRHFTFDDAGGASASSTPVFLEDDDKGELNRDICDNLTFQRENRDICENTFQSPVFELEDMEVEDAFNHTDHSVSIPIAIRRPPHPSPRLAPTPEEPEFESADLDRTQGRFRPIIGRSIGTQTPDPSDQEAGATGGTEPSSPLEHGHRARDRIRFYSDSQDPAVMERFGPLPDIIPDQRQRDRSLSLPNVPIYRRQSEVEVGRELRRISDEFHISYRGSIRRRRPEQAIPHSSSFPGRSTPFSFYSMWESLQQLFGRRSTPPEQVPDDEPDDHDEPDDEPDGP